MGHIRLLVQRQGVDLSRVSQILTWTLLGVFGWLQTHRQTTGLKSPAGVTFICDIIRSFDRYTTTPGPMSSQFIFRSHC